MFYRDASVQVTSEQVRVDGRAYPLAELARVWHRRGARSWRALAGRGVVSAALFGLVAAGVLALAAAMVLDASRTTTLILVVTAVLCGLATGPLADLLLDRMDRSYAHGVHSHEIWAHWRGHEILLLHTRDALRFGRIYRALQRAINR